LGFHAPHSAVSSASALQSRACFAAIAGSSSTRGMRLISADRLDLDLALEYFALSQNLITLPTFTVAA
jgi:hypothetical protein